VLWSRYCWAEFVTTVLAPITPSGRSAGNQSELLVFAFESVFGGVEATEAQLKRYLSQSMFPAMRLEPPEPLTEEFDVRTLEPSESAAAIGNFLVAGPHARAALPHLEHALSLDPESSLALESMGYMQLRMGQRDEAEKWLEKAAEAGSESYLLHYYRAVLSDEEPIRQERLRRAIELNPKFAPAYVLLSASYAQQPDRLTEAHTLAKKAVELEPAEASTWAQLGQVRLKMDRPDEARDALEQAIPLARSAEDERSISALTEAIDAFR